MPLIKYCLAGFGLLALPIVPASACSAPTEYPYDPTQYPSDIVIEGVATASGKDGGEPYADIDVSDVFLGSYSVRAFRLKWMEGGGGMCDPPGPDVSVGQKVRVYLSQESDEYRPQGWVLTNEFPKSKDQVQHDQAIAEEKIERQRKYFTAGGALSFNNPKNWLKIDDIRELRGSPGMVFVTFSVSPTGEMKNCTPGHVAKYVSLDLKACKIIVGRARLVPPKFAQEASGSFEMYPPDEERPTANVARSKSERESKPSLLLVILTLAAVSGSFLLWRFNRRRR